MPAAFARLKQMLAVRRVAGTLPRMRRLLAAFATPIILAQTPAPAPPPSWWMPTAGSGWIAIAPAKGHRPHLIIPVTIDGEATWALVDTGFNPMTLSKRFADAHRLPLTLQGQPESFGGPTAFYSTPAVTMAIGDVRTAQPQPFAVTDLDSLADLDLHPFDAVIGLALLGRVGWEVDEDGQRIRFVPPGTLPMTHPAPLRPGPDGGRLVTDLDLGPIGSTPAGVDTGSDDDLTLSTSLFARAGVPVLTDSASAGAGGLFVERLGRLGRATVGGATVTGPLTTESDQVSRVMGEPAMIGMGLMSRFNLRVDLPAGKMELVPRTTPVRPAPKSTVGAQGPLKQDRKMIVHVMLNSPAAAAGLKAGDAICAVNDRPMSRALYDSGWGTVPPGVRYTLRLCDGRTIALVTRAFY